MDTKDGQRFIIKIIKSEADLPKKEGFYIMQYKNKSIGFMNWWEQDWRDWLKNIDWYLQPIEDQESKPENEHDLIFKKDAIIKKQDNFLSYLLKYCGTSQRIRQYKFEINELKTK